MYRQKACELGTVHLAQLSFLIFVFPILTFVVIPATEAVQVINVYIDLGKFYTVLILNITFT
jgi:hypothetical protein